MLAHTCPVIMGWGRPMLYGNSFTKLYSAFTNPNSMPKSEHKRKHASRKVIRKKTKTTPWYSNGILIRKI